MNLKRLHHTSRTLLSANSALSVNDWAIVQDETRSLRMLLTAPRFPRDMTFWITFYNTFTRATRKRIPRLPTEVCERVIDWVAAAPPFGEMYFRPYHDDDALNTLRACALTCKAWTPRTRLHLFRVLRVRCSPTADGNVEDFAALLINNPALRSFTHTIMAKAVPDELSTLHVVPIKLPRMMSSLERLRVEEGLFYPAPGMFPSLKLLTSVTIVSFHNVEFCSVHDLRRIIGALRGLKTLYLFDPKWQNTTTLRGALIVQPSSPTSVRLHQLQISADRTWLSDPRSAQFMQWLGCSRILSSVTTLFTELLMVLNEAMLDAMELMIEASSQTVEEVQLNFCHDVNFSRCKSHRDSSGNES